MKLKNLIALLLALAMAFSLAACSGKDKNDEDVDKEDEKTEQTPNQNDEEEEQEEQNDTAEIPDYTALVDAYEDFVKDPSIKNYGKFYGGTLAGDEAADCIKALSYLLYDEDEDDFKREWEEEIGGITVQDAVAEDLDEEEISFRELPEAFANYLREEIKTLEGLSDSDWKKVARDEDMSADEAKKLGNDIISAMQSVVDKLENTKIDAAQRVTITIESEDGETDEIQFFFILADGKWYNYELIELIEAGEITGALE